VDRLAKPRFHYLYPLQENKNLTKWNTPKFPDEQLGTSFYNLIHQRKMTFQVNFVHSVIRVADGEKVSVKFPIDYSLETIPMERTCQSMISRQA
jgi:hypothetical protein